MSGDLGIPKENDNDNLFLCRLWTLEIQKFGNFAQKPWKGSTQNILMAAKVVSSWK